MPNGIEKQGIVTNVSQYGFRMEGEPDKFDYSRQADPLHATMGALVKVKVSRSKDDDKWWVNQLEVVEGAAPTNGASGPSRDYRATSAFLDHQDRETLIVRQTCLKAASEFLGRLSQTHEDVKSEHVLILAEKFEQWVNR